MNKDLEAEGRLDKAIGKTPACFGDLKQDVKDALKNP
jgi:uncharacterized protein YjbJ (UPF0337 family)